MADLPLLTTSAARAYRACPRLYSYEYAQGYRPAQAADTLRFGALFHRALEAWWRAAQSSPGAPHTWLVAALAALDLPAERPTEDSDDYELARARALLLGYHTRWSSAGLEVLGVEVEFVMPLENPTTGAASRTWRFGGKIDAIVRDGHRLRVVEHKTSSEDIGIGSDYWTRLTLDPQISNYQDGARALGYDVDSALYDVIKKPTQQPYKATPLDARKYTKPTKADPTPRLYANQRESDETPEEYYLRICEAIGADPDRYYQRGEVVRLAEERTDAGHDRWQIGKQIRESEKVNAWPRNPDACKRYGRTCAFFAVCTRSASLDDPTLFRRAERTHEELGAPSPNNVPLMDEESTELFL